MRQLIDPRLRSAIPDHWPDKCTIVQVLYRTTESNQQIPRGFVPVAGMVDIPCRIGPIIEVRPSDDEIRVTNVIEQYRRRQLKLNKYLPQIVPREMQALVDGVYYPIRGLEHDGSKFTTRLKLEVITP